MTELSDLEYMRWFTGLHFNHELFSTGATQVDYPGVLYNVTQSTKDPKKVPKYKGKSWKKVFVGVTGLDGEECYVTNQKPGKGEKNNHPDFEAGGHMTPIQSGVVKKGADTYLMPLCQWHNSTKRNTRPFEHSKTTMVKLSGFMEGDSAITFMMRMPSEEKFSALYIDPTTAEIEFRNIPTGEVLQQNLRKTIDPSAKSVIENFVLFERDDKNMSVYRVKEAAFK